LFVRVEVGGGSVFTAPAGSPGGVRAVADSLVAVLSHVAALGPGVRRGRDAAVESWSGASAGAFASYAESLVRLVDGSEEPLRAIGRALHRYAGALEVAQRAVEAASLVVPVAEGRREAGRAWRAYTAECVAVAGELESVAQGVAADARGSRVAEVLSPPAAGSGSGASPHLSEGQWRGLKMSLLDLQSVRGNGFGWVGYARYYERGAGSLLAQGRAWKASGDSLRVIQEALEGRNWGDLWRGGLTAEQMGPTLSRVGWVVEKAGKSLGRFGLGLGGLQIAADILDHNIDRAAYHGVTTALGTLTALPPPAGLACGTAALALTAGELLYDNVPAVKDFVDGGVDAVSEVADDVGDAVEDGWDAIAGIF